MYITPPLRADLHDSARTSRRGRGSRCFSRRKAATPGRRHTATPEWSHTATPQRSHPPCGEGLLHCFPLRITVGWLECCQLRCLQLLLPGVHLPRLFPAGGGLSSHFKSNYFAEM